MTIKHNLNYIQSNYNVYASSQTNYSQVQSDADHTVMRTGCCYSICSFACAYIYIIAVINQTELNLFVKNEPRLQKRKYAKSKQWVSFSPRSLPLPNQTDQPLKTWFVNFWSYKISTSCPKKTSNCWARCFSVFTSL